MSSNSRVDVLLQEYMRVHTMWIEKLWLDFCGLLPTAAYIMGSL